MENQQPTWWQFDDTGPFYSGRGSCIGLELTCIPNCEVSVSIDIWGLQVFDPLNRIPRNTASGQEIYSQYKADWQRAYNSWIH